MQKDVTYVLGQKVFDKKIDTPDGTIAEYVYRDHSGNPIYYDGDMYWVVLPNNEIQMYG